MTKYRHPTRLLGAMLLAAALLMGLLTMSASAAAPTADVTFTFSDSGITVSDPSDHGGYKTDGTTLTITAAGTYSVTGSCSEGSIEVKKEVTGVTLILDDLTLTSSTTAPLVCKGSTDTVLYLTGNSTLTNKEDPANEDSTDEAVADAFEGAAVKVKKNASLTIRGDGTLNADGSACKNGIKGGAGTTITVESGTLNITAANTGLASDEAVIIQGGTLNITSDNDGIKSAPDDDDTESAGDVTITGGTITIRSGDDAIHADGNAAITGGTFTIQSGDDAIHADFVTTIGTEGSSTGPAITVTACVEGIEGGKVYLHSGSASITASDDGVNAANDEANYEMLLAITGGDWYINAEGDGLDAGGNSTNNSGGDIIISGGVTQVFGAANAGNSALDFDGQMTYSGGTLLAVGMNGMAQMPSTGTYVVFGQSGGMGGGFVNTLFGGNGGNVSLTKGSKIAILDQSGNTLYSATAVKNANQVVFMSDALVSGSTYTLQVNGSTAASAAASAGNGQGGMQPGGQPGQGGMQPGGQQPGGQMIPPDQNQNGQQGTQPTDTNTGALPFTDVKSTDWYYDAVQYAYANGIMQGTGSTTFEPGTNLTRAMMVQILYNMENKPAVTKSSFSDVSSSAWYADAVAWAEANEIVAGYGDGSFGPDDSLTRAQAATILLRYAQYKGMSTTERTTLTFSDASDVPSWAGAAMQWCAAKGYLQGDDTGRLLPNGTATRAQIAAIMQRYLTAA